MQRVVLVLLLSFLFCFRPGHAMAAQDAMSGAQVNKGAPLFNKNLYIIKESEFAYVRLRIGSQQRTQKDKIPAISRTISAIKQAPAGEQTFRCHVKRQWDGRHHNSSRHFTLAVAPNKQVITDSNRGLVRLAGA